MLLYVVRVVLLLLSHKRNNPLTRCLFLVLRLLRMTPVLVVLRVTWYVVFLAMLFLRGVFVLVIYTVSMAGMVHKKAWGVGVLTVMRVAFASPVYYYRPSHIGLRSLFIRRNLGLVLFILLFLVVLILFTRYMISRRAAMRSL